jgi:prepilin-type N-terminal cleavage/methylation domain-containing protein/prepilin-type processing-associated H-X9-DG protein
MNCNNLRCRTSYGPASPTAAIYERRRILSGFTLLELLVTIAIIAIVAALLLPTLSRSKAEALNVACVNNFRQLTMSWHLYADDNQGCLVSVGYKFKSTGLVNSNAWVLGTMKDNVPGYPPLEPGVLDSTNENGIKWGRLFPYTKSVGIYHCPADKSATDGVPRVRSYSINGWMGGLPIAGQHQYRVFKCYKDIINPGPSKTWVFIDEHERSINDGWFAVDMVGNRGLLDAPATRHNNSYALSFADGHVEIWRLHDSRSTDWTKLPIPNTPPNVDWQRLRDASSSLLLQ